MFSSLLSFLPRWNYVCLKHFMCLFSCIVCNHSVNKMDAHNLAVCVAPSIFHKLDHTRPNDVESSLQTITFVEYLIDNCELVFGSDTFQLIKGAEVYLLAKRQESKQQQQQLQLQQQPPAVIVTSSSTNDLTEKTINAPVAVAAAAAATNAIVTDSNAAIGGSKKLKKSATTHKRSGGEFGRMLNLVSLKGKKSVAASSALKRPFCCTNQSMSARRS